MSIVWGPENLRPGTNEQWIRPWCSRYWLAPAWHSYTCCSPHSFLITINIHCIPTLCSVCRGTIHVNISLKLTCDWFFYAKYLHIHEGCCRNLILLYNFHLRNSLYMKNKFFVFLLFLLFSQSLSTKLGFKASCSLRDCLKLPFVKLLTELWTISLYTVIWQS